MRLILFPVVVACALPTLGSYHKIKEQIHVPHGWLRVGPAPKNHTIQLRIGLRQSDFETLEQHLLEVSDPNHSRYGQYLSKEQVESFVAPHPDSLRAVEEWLGSHNFDLARDGAYSPAKDWISLSAPLPVVERLLNTSFSVWKHASGDTIVRSTQYSLPAHLHDHIDVVQPSTNFGLFKRQRATSLFENELHSSNSPTGQILTSTNVIVNASCNSTITPECLHQLYSINYTGSSSTGNSIGTANYLEQYFNTTDLNAFYQTYVPAAVGNPVDVVEINGGINNQSAPGGEAALDSQYAFGLGYPARTVFYSTGGEPPFAPDNFTTSDSNEPYTDWLNHILAQSQAEIPLIVTTSYGDDEQSVPESYARRVCAGLAQLGARGVTVFFSSGDYGVGDGEVDPAQSACIANDGTNRRRFLPTFPSTCPYVVSVGGTRYVNEIGVSFSGGGLSNLFARPVWQELAVAQAKKHISQGTYQGLYNPNGRAFPDISAQSVHFAIQLGGRARTISGTSASTPAIAGIFAKLNDLRLENHLPPLGLVTPLLYAGLGFGFKDITVGNNPVSCGTPGFNATPGYDLVTGLGTPNFPQLKILTLGPFGM